MKDKTIELYRINNKLKGLEVELKEYDTRIEHYQDKQQECGFEIERLECRRTQLSNLEFQHERTLRDLKELKKELEEKLKNESNEPNKDDPFAKEDLETELQITLADIKKYRDSIKDCQLEEEGSKEKLKMERWTEDSFDREEYRVNRCRQDTDDEYVMLVRKKNDIEKEQSGIAV